MSELGDKLGPILWQFAPFKQFDEADFAKFLALLPKELDGLKLNHVVEVRHRSFENPRFVELLRESGVTPVYTDAETWPNIADLSGDVVYARLQQGDDTLDAAYPPAELDAWAARAKTWAKGEVPQDLRLLAPATASKPRPATCSSILSTKAN